MDEINFDDWEKIEARVAEIVKVEDVENADKLYKTPLHIKTLVSGREIIRHNQQFVKADTLRNKVKSLGYDIEDTSYGPFVWPNRNRKSHPKT